MLTRSDSPTHLLSEVDWVTKHLKKLNLNFEGQLLKSGGTMSHINPSSTKSQGSQTLFIAPIQLSLSEMLG